MPSSSTSHSRRLRIGAAAKFLGVHRVKAKKLALEGHIPYYMIGDDMQFERVDLEAYLLHAKRPATVHQPLEQSALEPIAA